jgi:hypothetical protein
VDPGDRLGWADVSVLFQQREHLFDCSGGRDPVDPEQLADQRRGGVEAQVEQGGHDSVREVELWHASATWSVPSLASSPVVPSGFALIGPGIG